MKQDKRVMRKKINNTWASVHYATLFDKMHGRKAERVHSADTNLLTFLHKKLTVKNILTEQ